jgi:archaellum component FlaG (FlaF/FlaG flagellin family)
MKREKHLLVIILFLTIALLISINHLPVAKADAAPPPGAVASNLFSNLNQTKVCMEAETVVIAIPEQSDNYGGHAVVTATFYMRNMGTETEELNARFPMNMSEYSMGYEIKNGVEYSQFPSIDNLSVFIDGEQVNIATTENDVDLYETMGAPEGTIRHIKCWAHFHVIFPPGEQVVIQIQYKVSGYQKETRHIIYKYILQTGQGWYDTIGSADIVVTFPYDLNEQNTVNISPDNYSFSENTINWHFENFEPEENIQFEVIDPSIWSGIIREKVNIEKNPEDGEAWGRLGKYYKEAITQSKGFLFYSDTPEFFQNSMDAYKKALELLPDDIYWHYGYVELVCKASMIEEHNHSEKSELIKQECNEQLRYILDHDPEHEETLVILQWVRNMTKSYPDGEIAEYLVLTPMPTRTATPVPSSIAPSKTSTLPLTWTPSPTKTEITKSNTSMPTIDSYESPNIEQNRLIFSIGANILLVALLFFTIRPVRTNK